RSNLPLICRAHAPAAAHLPLHERRLTYKGRLLVHGRPRSPPRHDRAFSFERNACSMGALLSAIPSSGPSEVSARLGMIRRSLSQWTLAATVWIIAASVSGCRTETLSAEDISDTRERIPTERFRSPDRDFINTVNLALDANGVLHLVWTATTYADMKSTVWYQ